MTSLSATDIFAQSVCILSILLKLQLLLLYQRLPCEQRNIHFKLVLISSLFFAVVMLFLGFGDFISKDILSCTSFPTIAVFVLAQNFSDACLVGYGLSFFPRFKSFAIVMVTFLGAILFATAELLLTYSNEPTIPPCRSSFVSSRDAIVAALAMQLFLFVIIILLVVAVFMYKVKDEETKRVNAGHISVVSILIVGALATTSVVVLLVSNRNANVDLINYSNLTIVYSVEGCIISVLAITTCPLLRAQLHSLVPKKRKKAKVDAMPRQQLYCSMMLRSRRMSPAKAKANTPNAAEHRSSSSTLPISIIDTKVTPSEQQQPEA